MANGKSIIVVGRPAQLKWHRLRRSMVGPECVTAVIAAGFAFGAWIEPDLMARGEGRLAVPHCDQLERETTNAGPVADWRGNAVGAITDRPSLFDVLILSERLAEIMPSAHRDALLHFVMKEDLDAVGLRGIDHLSDHIGSRRLATAEPVLISISSSARRSAPSVSRFFAFRVVFDAIGNPYQFGRTLAAAGSE